MPDINTVDLIVFGVLLLSCVLGVVRGVTREFLGIISWVGAILLPLYLLPLFRPFTTLYIKNELLADIVICISLFAIALLLLGLATGFVSGKVKDSALGGLDRSLGLVYGVVRTWVLFSLVYIAAAFIVSPEQFPLMVRTAKVTPLVERGANWLRLLVPESTFKNIQIALKSGKATPTPPPVKEVVSVLSQPLPKVLEPSKKGPSTKRVSDVKGF